MTQEYLEEVMPSFITLQVVTLFHLNQQNIQLYIKITPQQSRLFTLGNFRARLFCSLYISKRNKGLFGA